MSSSEEEVELSDENSDESPLSLSPEYEIEHESDGAFASQSAREDEDAAAAFAEKIARLSKSSGLKCTEHITKYFDGCHFVLFCLTKPTHFFLFLLASGRSSSIKGITCSDIPLTSSF